MHLVPFGEYIPFLKFLPFLAALSPYQGGTLPSLSPGPGPVRFDLAGAVAAPIICFEDTIPHVVRRYWTDGGQQPELLLNLTNDGWYEDSAEHEVHLLVAALRSIELRTPMVRAVNTGISAVIDGNGHITARLPIVTPGALVAMTPLDDRQSLYSQWGDWLPLTCFAIVIGWVPLSWTRIGRPAVQLESKTPPLPFLPKRPR
jgi:apolipoprotein N-acyltransferase